MLNFPRWKVFLILLTCALGIVFAIPSMVDRETRAGLPEWLRPVNLGLDLQGGSHLLLEVDVQEGLKDQYAAAVDDARMVLRSHRVGYVDLKPTNEGISFRMRDIIEREKVESLIKREMPDYQGVVEGLQVNLTLTLAAQQHKIETMLRQSIEIVRRRIDEYGTSEPDIQQQGEDRILIQLPGVGDPARVKELLGRTAKLSYRMVHPQSAQLLNAGRIPPGYERLESVDADDHHFYLVEKRIILTGENLEDASVGHSDKNNQPVVNMVFDTAGARRFGQITTEKTGHQMAIVLDNKILSAPVLTEPIWGGRTQISGRFSMKAANDLAILMRSGVMPAPLKVLEERTVGPSLGADSIHAGKLATGLSVAAVSVFMMLCYALCGVVANIALIFNLIFIIAAMGFLGTTLTLPGIAGIALTLGMAVDANVLIYERIKEELREGRATLQAIEAGYHRAISTIVDANLTTLIGAVALFAFGSGSIRGFAVTLSIGIIASMFTAIVLTRFLISQWMRRVRPVTLSI